MKSTTDRLGIVVISASKLVPIVSPLDVFFLIALERIQTFWDSWQAKHFPFLYLSRETYGCGLGNARGKGIS